MSELKLNIYKLEKNEKGERVIEKTYVSNTFDILYGPIEDVLGLIDASKLNDNAEVVKALFAVLQQIKPILKDVFFGLTDDELKRTKSDEIVGVTVLILKNAVEGIVSSSGIKNLLGEQKM